MTIKKKRFGLKDIEKKYGRLTFGQMIEAHRLGEEMTLKEFSMIIGMSVSSISDLEKGRKIPSPSRAVKIAKKLGMSEKLFVEVALQDELIKEGLESFKVSVA